MVGGLISEYNKYFSYGAKIGYIEWNHENKKFHSLKYDHVQGRYGVFYIFIF